MLNWETQIRSFKTYLQLEKSLSSNTVEAYLRDINGLKTFISDKKNNAPDTIELQDLLKYIEDINLLGISARSQARIISGIKAFYRYLILEDLITNDPTDLLETPKIPEKLPIVLAIEEIDELISAIDLSTNEGHRNKAIVETLYSCGLRVSELVGLSLSDCHFKENYIVVTGKGNKQRIVPIGEKAIKDINYYIDGYRNHMKINPDFENILFLNRRGKQLTRVMIFTIIKNLAKKIELKKNISPHTFRHSFATHLLDGGADLRAIQEMLGHESIVTTEIYTHLDKEYLRDTIINFHPRS